MCMSQKAHQTSSDASYVRQDPKGWTAFLGGRLKSDHDLRLMAR